MPIISNTVQNNGRSQASATPRSHAYKSGGVTVRLQEGQTLKGVVSDIHGNEITLSMEDGSSFTGKLPDANQYSIGQKAAFLITGLADNTIYLKAVTGAYLLDMEDTIEQALEEANLPKTERNLEVVRSLLQNRQSISRENILDSIRLCSRFPDAGVDAVITMKRLQMPMTEASVRQFENYQERSHSLLSKMNVLTDSLGDMLTSIGTQVPRLSADIGARILSLALSSPVSPEESALPALRTPDPALPADVLLLSTPKEAAAAELNDDPAKEGRDTVEEAASPDSADFFTQTEDDKNEINTDSPLSRMRRLISGIADAAQTARTERMAAQTASASPYSADETGVFIHEQTGFILSTEERLDFADFLSDYPLSDKIRQSLADGTSTAREFLNAIQSALSDMTEEQTGKLLASKTFQSLIKAQFHSNWTISPKQLKDPGSMEQIYRQMTHDFDALTHFCRESLGQDLFPSVSSHAQDMQDNMDFMRTLNQTFQYMQLPLKLQNQNAHGDLYVMTRKEALKKNPRHLKVLLHLELDSLGTLDIHVDKENTAISAHFYVERKEAGDLMEKNAELLTDALNRIGYALHTKFSLKEKEIDIVKDFITTEAPVGDFKRYNFDLRA